MPLPLPRSRAEIEKIQRERKQIAVERALRAPFHVDADRLDDPD